MKKFAFVSPHQPTPEQYTLAAATGIELAVVGDRDAFGPSASVLTFGDDCFDGVVVVHPSLAVRFLACGLTVGIYENSQRSEEGVNLTFYAKSLHLFDAFRVDEYFQIQRSSND